MKPHMIVFLVISMILSGCVDTEVQPFAASDFGAPPIKPGYYSSGNHGIVQIQAVDSETMLITNQHKESSKLKFVNLGRDLYIAQIQEASQGAAVSYRHLIALYSPSSKRFSVLKVDEKEPSVAGAIANNGFECGLFGCRLSVRDRAPSKAEIVNLFIDVANATTSAPDNSSTLEPLSDEIAVRQLAAIERERVKRESENAETRRRQSQPGYAQPPGCIKYIVQRGDTLVLIAEKNSVDWREIQTWNRIGQGGLAVGDAIVVKRECASGR